MIWNNRIVLEIEKQVGGLVRDYLKDIEKAFISSEDALKVGMVIKIAPAKGETGLDIATDMSFIAVKVKDSASGTVSDQGELPLGGDTDAPNKEPEDEPDTSDYRPGAGAEPFSTEGQEPTSD